MKEIVYDSGLGNFYNPVSFINSKMNDLFTHCF